MHETVVVAMPPFERHLSILALGAAVSPLLGLLGTVTGMIHTFSLIAVFGTGDAHLLSGGISEALVTTEAGLVVAIPLLILHTFLTRRVRAIADGLERSAITFVNALRSRQPTGSGGAPSDQDGGQ
jgi:biopolymer transport protein ExbB